MIDGSRALKCRSVLNAAIYRLQRTRVLFIATKRFFSHAKPSPLDTRLFLSPTTRPRTHSSQESSRVNRGHTRLSGRRGTVRDRVSEGRRSNCRVPKTRRWQCYVSAMIMHYYRSTQVNAERVQRHISMLGKSDEYNVYIRIEYAFLKMHVRIRILHSKCCNTPYH